MIEFINMMRATGPLGSLILAAGVAGGTMTAILLVWSIIKIVCRFVGWIRS